MCGITGIAAFNETGIKFLDNIRAANSTLGLRGPDNEGFYHSKNLALGHKRLSIIDVSESANQPMSDPSGRYTIIFNGEFFNFGEHRKSLLEKGVQLRTTSDTEVLLHLYIREGKACLDKINGFFALAIYDNTGNTLFIARDRMGIKPLWYYCDDDKLIFASELKALIAAGVPRVVDRLSILNYLQLNYVPGPWSIFEGVRKLKPGHFMFAQPGISKSITVETPFYVIPKSYKPGTASPEHYEQSKTTLKKLLSESVQKRLIADVPLGAFLSGGIDSSVIVALASQHTQHLNTFSIGYKDEPMYDETRYARLVADKYHTNHTVFSLSNDDLFENLFSVLEYIDEPFADSSALAVNILSMHTRRYVKVALSGDGADEMFGGYNKHRAEWILRNKKMFTLAAVALSPVLSPFAGARNSPFSNKIRQLHRFAQGAKLSPADRYWRWCAFVDEPEIDAMTDFVYDNREYYSRKNEILSPLASGSEMNDLLYMDMNMVLVNDMLVKVDMMSMACSLEVRVPFLDYNLVNFAFSLPSEYKIDRQFSKKILRDAFRDELPPELFNRAKHGFEVPLLKWFRTGLRNMIENDLLSKSFIDRQGLFSYEEISELKKRLFSPNPGDIEARIWGLIVFQYWWKKYMD